MTDKRFICIAGCPRSGTTALATIIGWADSCFIGQERFNLLFNRTPDRFVPDLFTPDRIRDFQPFDCGYRQFSELPVYSSPSANPGMLEGLDKAEVFGDKLISLHRNFGIFDTAAWRKEDVTVVYIIRDAVEVAASYQKRFENSNDAWSEDYAAGIATWSSSIIKLHSYLNSRPAEGSVKYILIEYSSLFQNDPSSFLKRCENLFEVIGLNFGEGQRQGLEKLHRSTIHVANTRVINQEMRSHAKQLITEDVLESYKELVDRTLFPEVSG